MDKKKNNAINVVTNRDDRSPTKRNSKVELVVRAVPFRSRRC